MLRAADRQFSSFNRQNMAQRATPAQIAVREAQHKIFNKLCIAYRRSRQDPEFAVRADDLRRDLAIPENVFAEALDTFVDVKSPNNR